MPDFRLLMKLVEYYECTPDFPVILKEFLELDKQQIPTFQSLRSISTDRLIIENDYNETMSNTPAVGIADIKANELMSIFNNLKKDSVMLGITSAFYN